MNSPQRTACLAKVNAKGPFFFTYRKFSNDGNWNPESGIRKLETGDRTDIYQILFSHGWYQPLRDNYKNQKVVRINKVDRMEKINDQD